MKTDEDGKERKLKYRECTILEGDFTISMVFFYFKIILKFFKN